jgi:hypothetical protein
MVWSGERNLVTEKQTLAEARNLCFIFTREACSNETLQYICENDIPTNRHTYYTKKALIQCLIQP